MKVVSIRKNPQWAETAKAYCEEKWSDVYGAFEDTLNQCLQKENRLPETWIMVGGMQEDEIKGFYQLCDAEPVENETKRSPWLTTLFVEPDLRGWHYGELLMNHARYEAGKLGFDKMYLATDQAFMKSMDFGRLVWSGLRGDARRKYMRQIPSGKCSWPFMTRKTYPAMRRT